MALNMANYIMTHSIKVSNMPNMSKNQNQNSDEDAVSAILSAKSIFAVGGLLLFPPNLLCDTQSSRQGRKFERDFLNIKKHFSKQNSKQIDGNSAG